MIKILNVKSNLFSEWEISLDTISLTNLNYIKELKEILVYREDKT